MPLLNYGLLTGKLTDHGPQHGGNPHYLLIIQAGVIQYRVAVNLQSTEPQGDNPAALQYRILDNLAGSDLAKSITNRNAFILRDEAAENPTLDFVHDGLLDMSKFIELKAGLRAQSNPLYKALATAAEDARAEGAFVAVFGTGYPDQDDLPQGPGNNPQRTSSGFTGVDNVHMNQGNYLRVGTHMNRHFQENGRHQDGAVLFFLADGTVHGFFTKFKTQDIETDEFGNPIHTGVDELDANRTIKPSVRKKLTARPAELEEVRRDVIAGKLPVRPRTASRTTLQRPARGGASVPIPPSSTAEIPVSGTSGGQAANGHIFGDTTSPDDPNRPFETDDDSQYRYSQFVENFAKYGVPEPVPGPRNGVYPKMQLADVLDKSAIKAITGSKQIVFHIAGDTGSPDASKLPHEVSVADLMIADFDPSIDSPERPAFYYNVGDVVYYYGEAEYYYSQFYKPYKAYPAPIFAIPGNHDGITYLPTMTSLAGFINAFCDDQARHWSAAGAIGRTTMTQPGVYFTLDCPFVSIIGLYSNCGESYGYIDDQQKLFLYNELIRLKPLRESGKIAAVLLAVHHSPMAFTPKKPASSALRDAIDAATDQAGFWPDAVLSGHAHVYQRMTRNVTVGRDTWQVPHIISGSGGYDANAAMEVDKKDMAVLDMSDPDYRLHAFYAKYGYMRLTVKPASGNTPSTLRVEFFSPDGDSGKPLDVFLLNLDTHQLI